MKKYTSKSTSVLLASAILFSPLLAFSATDTTQEFGSNNIATEFTSAPLLTKTQKLLSVDSIRKDEETSISQLASYQGSNEFSDLSNKELDEERAGGYVRLSSEQNKLRLYEQARIKEQNRNNYTLSRTIIQRSQTPPKTAPYIRNPYFW